MNGMEVKQMTEAEAKAQLKALRNQRVSVPTKAGTAYVEAKPVIALEAGANGWHEVTGGPIGTVVCSITEPGRYPEARSWVMPAVLVDERTFVEDFVEPGVMPLTPEGKAVTVCRFINARGIAWEARMSSLDNATGMTRMKWEQVTQQSRARTARFQQSRATSDLAKLKATIRKDGGGAGREADADTGEVPF